MKPIANERKTAMKKMMMTALFAAMAVIVRKGVQRPCSFVAWKVRKAPDG